MTKLTKLNKDFFSQIDFNEGFILTFLDEMIFNGLRTINVLICVNNLIIIIKARDVIRFNYKELSNAIAEVKVENSKIDIFDYSQSFYDNEPNLSISAKDFEYYKLENYDPITNPYQTLVDLGIVNQ